MYERSFSLFTFLLANSIQNQFGVFDTTMATVIGWNKNQFHKRDLSYIIKSDAQCGRKHKFLSANSIYKVSNTYKALTKFIIAVSWLKKKYYKKKFIQLDQSMLNKRRCYKKKQTSWHMCY